MYLEPQAQAGFWNTRHQEYGLARLRVDVQDQKGGRNLGPGFGMSRRRPYTSALMLAYNSTGVGLNPMLATSQSAPTRLSRVSIASLLGANSHQCRFCHLGSHMLRRSTPPYLIGSTSNSAPL
ncbi:uncharacterized protein PAN0_001c0437 [Moesziomyces antarcticus]|uniref:uncharacterized protein n=1 Tax=Pseudozyma antarctica TaxID=84753 RepID=UPI0007194EB9|nr:uncharacterized protein PAN0_001c0437 [Moesziomyces antarcticus]GAK62239.1 hypothetical protein PAN0_001c0437 [Moesziomyces antarcticus]